MTAASAGAGAITISDVTVTEGNSGTQIATFTVAHTGGSGAFAVNYATSNGTATAGSDYVAKSGILNFAAGETTRTISVTISGDITIEPSETFFVNLANATNGAIIADGQGQGTIVNNDGVGDDYADSFFDFSAPFGQVNAGSTLTGNLETIGDRDWIRVSLVAGSSFTIDLEGQDTGGGTLLDPYLRLYSGSGSLITENDDGGDGANSRLIYIPGSSGTYYIAAGSYLRRLRRNI